MESAQNNGNKTRVKTHLPFRPSVLQGGRNAMPANTNSARVCNLLSNGFIGNTSKAGQKRIGQKSNIPLGTHTGNSSRILKSSRSTLGNQRLTCFKNTFCRPSFDVSTARKKMVERIDRIAERSKMNETEKKIDNIGGTIVKTPMKHTPIKPPLRLALFQLSEYRNKCGTPVKDPGDHRVMISPFQECGLKKELLRNGKVSKCQLKDDSHLSVAVFDSDENMKENKTPEFVLQTPRNGGSFLSGGKTHVLNNVLKHCQLYSSKLSNIYSALEDLDESFQRIALGEMGFQIYSQFCKYQTVKQGLYREIKVIEEELEENMKNELDIKLKLEEYKKKKSDVMNERLELHEKFKNSVIQMIDAYEKETSKPASGQALEDIIKTFSSECNFNLSIMSSECNDLTENQKLHQNVRRSKRLLQKKRISKNNETTPKSHRKTGGEKIENDDDFVLRKSGGTNDKKKIQRLMYTEVQKSFNPCSPESSF